MLHNGYIGSGGTPAEDLPAIFYDSISTSIISGTTVTIENWKVDTCNLLIAFVAARDVLQVPTGWQLLYTSPTVGTSSQKLSILFCQNPPSTVSVSFVQNSAARMYVNLLSFKEADIPIIISNWESYATPRNLIKSLKDVFCWCGTIYSTYENQSWSITGESSSSWYIIQDLVNPPTAGATTYCARLVTVVDTTFSHDSLRLSAAHETNEAMGIGLKILHKNS